MTSSLVQIQDEEQVVLTHDFHDLSIEDHLVEKGSDEETHKGGFGNHGGICAICLDKIVLQETALVKGCEHAYCVTCILRWATYNNKVTCPQCKNPFEFLNVHRSLDGSIEDCMFEESVCLLLRAKWFKPLTVEDHVVVHEDTLLDELEDYYYHYEEDDEDLDDAYYGGSSSFRIGNRRWGDNGYVRAGRQEARPVHRSNTDNSGASSGASSSRQPKKKEAAKSAATTGRRAKRALKREAADKAAEAKHQQHLIRLGRK
uniref:RING-type domain-containing protein n=1 Tax=Lotus japonicus TaxID=34305 RepID=I3SBA7_LOTJA|nr:unknown [Lotus japonicus]